MIIGIPIYTDKSNYATIQEELWRHCHLSCVTEWFEKVISIQRELP